MYSWTFKFRKVVLGDDIRECNSEIIIKSDPHLPKFCI